jgi:hypothetical protein
VIALLNYIPLYCPSCGTPTRLDRADNTQLVIFEALKALNCVTCGAMYQLADRTDILRAATARGGDMIEYFLGDDEQDESGNGRT